MYFAVVGVGGQMGCSWVPEVGQGGENKEGRGLRGYRERRGTWCGGLLMTKRDPVRGLGGV